MSAAKKTTRTIGWRAIVKRLALIALILMALPIPFILLFAVVQPPVTSVMLQRVAVRAANGDTPIWPAHTTVSRAGLSPNLRRAVLASEDDRFYLHFGIDVVEINNALERRRRGGKLRGASTLTQQVAKNLFLWSGRSCFRKGLEAWFTVLIEVCWSKQRILEVYLNVAQFGQGIYGVEAASRLLFATTAADLGSGDAALLAAVLPNPVKFRADAPSDYVRGRQRWILRQMGQ